MNNLNPEQLLKRFSTHLRNAVAKSMALATSFGHVQVSPTHLLFALLEETGSIASEILKKLNLDKNVLTNILAGKPQIRPGGGGVATANVPDLNPKAKQTLERAMLFAYEREHSHVGTEHMLLGLIYSKDADIDYALKQSKINPQDIENQLENILQSISNFPDMEEVTGIMSQIEENLGQSAPLPPIEQNQVQKAKPKQQRWTALDVFTTDLTNKQAQKNINPVIGREREIERIINILCRKNKNNPVLVGEPGVGKTAIVEGLAKRIAEGEVPDILKNKKILSLDLTLMIAGTIYRGEFEARLKQVIDEVGRSPNCILFIDELHNIIGAGSSQGAMDAANILKPALARGQLRCIGATTIDEYKKHISNDPALERRFQSVNISEPNAEDTIKILQGIKKYYEDYHETQITEEAMKSAVELSVRYVHDNFLPDKAIDLMDEACASMKVKQKLSPLQAKRQALLRGLENCRDEKEEAILQEKFEKAIEWKKRAEELEKELGALNKKTDNPSASSGQVKKSTKQKVTPTEIARVLANKLNINPDTLLTNDWDRLDKLSEQLKQHIIGQDKVIGKVVKHLRQAHLGLAGKKRPLASFLFAGPSGVGKTELAKVLAKELYNDENALVKLDMSEFSEAHSTSKLLGSPAGYVGHKERNRFTDEIQRKPYCVVLFDEIDKAHKDVAKLLLQILDEGELTDSAGKKTYFHHAIVVLTTNLGAELFKSSGIGFGKGGQDDNNRDASVIGKLKEELSPTLITRLGSICIFSPLTKNDVEQIIKKQINEISAQLKSSQKLSITPDKSAISELAKQSYSDDFGARQVEKVIQNTVQELVINVLREKKHKANYELTGKCGKFVLS